VQQSRPVVKRKPIKKEHIVGFGEPEDEIKNAYNSKFGSGIVVASSGNIQIPS
jgi:hypothetical protein